MLCQRCLARWTRSMREILKMSDGAVEADGQVR